MQRIVSQCKIQVLKKGKLSEAKTIKKPLKTE